MFLVDRMTMAPATCMICGSGNTPYEDSGDIGPYIDLGVDYGWGDSAYLCLRPSCASKIAVLAGYIAPDTAKDYEREVKRLRKLLHDANSDKELAQRQARKAKRVPA